MGSNPFGESPESDAAPLLGISTMGEEHNDRGTRTREDQFGELGTSWGSNEGKRKTGGRLLMVVV